MICKIKTSIFTFLFLLNFCALAQTLPTIHPKQGTIQKSFSELAKTQLEKTYSINMPISGELERINEKAGAQIKKGQLLTELVQIPIIQAIKEAKAQIATYKAYMVYQQRQLARQKPLAKKHFVSESDLDNTIAQIDISKAQLVAQQTKLKTAEYNLKISKLFSPVSGIILNKYTEGGQWLAAGTPLLQIGNLADIEVISDVLSQDAQQLKIGGKVILTSIGSSVVLTGKIKRIEPAGFTKKSALGVDEQRVNVIATINNPEKANLGIGYRLQAEFLLGVPNPKALIVPRFSVLQDSDNNSYVFKIVDKKLKKQIIKTGITTDTQIEVTQGLSANDTILSQPTADMQDGDKV